jgi:hypothetical protein
VIEEKVNQKKYFTEKGCDLLEIENSLYKIDNQDDERELFMKTINYETYITKLAIQHILSKLEESSVPVKGFLKDRSFYTEGEKLHFTYEKERINSNDIYFIEKLDQSDHIFSQFENNYSIDGRIQLIEKSSIQLEKYPNLGEIIIEVRLLDRISFVLSDSIMLNSHKKIKLYEIINEYVNSLFHVLSEKDYHKYELDRYIHSFSPKN